METPDPRNDTPGALKQVGFDTPWHPMEPYGKTIVFAETPFTSQLRDSRDATHIPVHGWWIFYGFHVPWATPNPWKSQGYLPLKKNLTPPKMRVFGGPMVLGGSSHLVSG